MRLVTLPCWRRALALSNHSTAARSCADQPCQARVLAHRALRPPPPVAARRRRGPQAYDEWEADMEAAAQRLAKQQKHARKGAAAKAAKGKKGGKKANPWSDDEGSGEDMDQDSDEEIVVRAAGAGGWSRGCVCVGGGAEGSWAWPGARAGLALRWPRRKRDPGTLPRRAARGPTP